MNSYYSDTGRFKCKGSILILYMVVSHKQVSKATTAKEDI